MSDLMLTFSIILAALCGFVFGVFWCHFQWRELYKTCPHLRGNETGQWCALAETQSPQPDYVEQAK